MPPRSAAFRRRFTQPLWRHQVAAACLVVLAGTTGTAQANIDIVFDYTYDTGFFTSNPLRMSLLDAAALTFESRLTDTLTAITSGSGNTFNAHLFHPSNTATAITLNAFSVLANEVRIFVGASSLGGALAVGGPGSYSASGSAAFLDNVVSRGQAGALGAEATRTDFGPWGGVISFDTATSWYYDNNPSTAEPFPGSFDFYSVAVHELGHVLGLGTQPSWDNRVTGSTFNGTAAGTRALTSDGVHWAVGTLSTVGLNVQEASMSPTIGEDVRKHFTTLDYDAMTDIGWQVSAVPEPTTWMMWGVGGVLLAGLRRRQAARLPAGASTAS